MNKLKNLDQETIKLTNQKQILQLLYKNKEMTKQEISKALKVTIPTVISNVNELIEQGYIDEAGVAKSTGGRKPVIVRFLPESRYSFGVSITKSKIRVILTNLDFKIKEEVIIDSTDKFKTLEDGIIEVSKSVKAIMNKLDIPKEKILGIGFALPGTVNENKLILENAPNLHIKNVDFNKYKKYFDFPIYIENEANAAVCAEAFIGSPNNMNNVIFVSITEGIGTGMLIGDNLFKGINKRAGEFGHMSIVKDGIQCNCGRKGCWEKYASRRALTDEFYKKLNVKVDSFKEFFQMAENDEEAANIIDKYLDYLAEGIKNIILMMDPKYIIIGGEIAYFQKIIGRALTDKIFETNSFYNAEDCKILFSNLKDNAPLIGASWLSVERLFFVNKRII